MHQFDINVENLSKIEGHLDLTVHVEDNKVKDVFFKIIENKRFFQEAIHGKPYATIPQQMSRICGTCSIAHLLCSIEAIEKALQIQLTPQSILLRKLITYGLMIRDHALHLYVFSMPDVVGKDSILEFDENDELEHQLLHDMFEVKKAGNKLSTVVGGRAVHAPFPAVGGFLKIPAKEDLEDVIVHLKKIRDKIFLLMKVFDECEFSFERETKFVGLKTKDFSFLEGDVICSDGGFCVKEEYFKYQLEEVVIPYSTAKGYVLEGQSYMTGSLARLNMNKEALHPNTQKDAKKFIDRFPSIDIYKNNLAQAIEILHSVDHALEILENNEFVDEKPVKGILPETERDGIGVIEAPRGTLYHRVKVNSEGIVTDSDVVVPTEQNQINVEIDIKTLVQNHLDKGTDDKDFIRMEIEKLIRAYDPCMSCATHFLKINWEEM